MFVNNTEDAAMDSDNDTDVLNVENDLLNIEKDVLGGDNSILNIEKNVLGVDNDSHVFVDVSDHHHARETSNLFPKPMPGFFQVTKKNGFFLNLSKF
jgi:hypothetical protein